MSASMHALVFGNGAYVGTMALKTATQDAIAMSEALRKLNFNVTTGIDLNLQQMRSKITDFLNLLSNTTASVSLFYYSGHGLQLEDQNLIVPVDFHELFDDPFVRVQDIIDGMTESSEIRIIFLDACRTDPSAQAILETKSASSTNGIKTAFDSAKTAVTTGLAEMKAHRNTFIAFAATAGGKAYDGTSELSPFTSSLVKNIDVIDLPLTHLLARVRIEVFALTNGKQKTWDYSSLDLPFFFNPGSMLLFAGNLMALIGLVLALVPYTLIIASGDSAFGSLLAATCLPAGALIILLIGMNSVYSRLRANLNPTLSEGTTVKDHFALSIRKGLVGGYLGALLGSLWIAIPYQKEWVRQFIILGQVEAPQSIGQTTVEITVATAMVACVLGSLSLLFTRIVFKGWRFSIAKTLTSRRILLGAALGGSIAGIICAPILLSHFGQFDRPKLLPKALLPGAIIGTSIIIFAVVNFDFERLSRRRLLASALASLTALIAGGVATIAVFGPLTLTGAVDAVTSMLNDHFQNVYLRIFGGIIYGWPVGFVLGIVIGIAIVLTQRWSSKPVI